MQYSLLVISTIVVGMRTIFPDMRVLNEMEINEAEVLDKYKRFTHFQQVITGKTDILI